MAEINARIATLADQSKDFAKKATITAGAGFSLALLASFLVFDRLVQGAHVRVLGIDPGTLGMAFVVGATSCFVIAWWYFTRHRAGEQRITDEQFEKDLLAFGMPPFVSRAEKLLSINQIQLRRYYEMNLQQARAIFVVGILCMMAGLGVIGATFAMLKAFDNVQAQLVVGAVGAVGAVLSNYVAAVFFRIYGEVGRSIMQFHQQLAETHDLFFANLIASGIPDEDRSKTLVQLALAIVAKRQGSESAGKTRATATQDI